MFTPRRIIIKRYVEEMMKNFHRVYADRHQQHADILDWAAYWALEKIAQSDCMYHNLEHTIMVSAVGQEMLLGMRMRGKILSVDDWLHVNITLLTFSLGFVRGICDGDNLKTNNYRTGVDDELVQIPPGSTGAALIQHVTDRAILTVKNQFETYPQIDMGRLVRYQNAMRFPPQHDADSKNSDLFVDLVCGCHFFGAIADPNFMRKSHAVFQEWQESGLAAEMGYHSILDYKANYIGFFKNQLAPFIKPILPYLNETREGQRWIANMVSHLHNEIHGEESMGIVRQTPN